MFLNTGYFLLYTNSLLPNWAVFVINAIAFFLILKLSYFLFKKIVGLISSKTKTTLDDELIRIIEYPLIVALCVIFLLSSVNIFELSESTINLLNNTGYILLVVIVTWFLYSLIGVVFIHLMVPFAQKSKSELDDQIFPLVRKILRVIVVVLAIIYVLDILGLNITPLLAGAGIVGLAFAFAAQKILADLFGGISILMDGSLFVKDRIKVDNIEGDVIEIGLRSTKIKTLDNNVVTIPNSILASSKIENLNTQSKSFTVRMRLSITYDTSMAKLEKAKEIIQKILKKNNMIDANYTTNFTEFSDSALILLTTFTIKDFRTKNKILDEINTSIKREFDKHKIDFAYPTQSVFLHNAK